jgi:hypothetical protein
MATFQTVATVFSEHLRIAPFTGTPQGAKELKVTGGCA